MSGGPWVPKGEVIMGSDNTLNLDQVGVQSRAGKAQGDQAEGHDAANRNLGSKLEPMDQQFKGRGGSTFATGAVANLQGGSQLGKRLAELALNAVLGEKAALQADETAEQDGKASVTTATESQGLLSKPISI